MTDVDSLEDVMSRILNDDEENEESDGNSSGL